MAFPLADSFTTLYPWQLLDARWRFGAVGLVSSSLLLPALGLLLAAVTAWWHGQPKVLLVLSILGFLSALVALLSIGFFALDALQTRAMVRPEMQRSFAVASVTAALKTGLAGAVFLALGLSGWRASRGTGARTSSSERKDVLLPLGGSSLRNP